MAAMASIPKSSGKLVRKAVSRWNAKCEEAVRERNRAFRRLKRTHNFQHLIDYKQAQAVVRRSIRQRKRTYWRDYCSSIGSTININDVWGMIKKMEGYRREWNYPILSDGEQLAISNLEKAEMMVKTMSKVHSSSNLSEEERRGREETRSLYTEIIQKKDKIEDKCNVPFTLRELRNALDKCKNSAPGKDEICYSMLRHLSETGIQKVLNVFNKVWEEEKIPAGWKEAVIVPIRKPGKDASNPANYRPIALTSHLGKLMERLVNGRIMHFIEERGVMTSCQSGFRKGRSSIDSVLCLEDEIRKAQVKKETVVAVFLDVEKAYDMLWVEGLLIKMHMLGIGGNMFNWMMDFLNNRSIQVKIGKETSRRCLVENGTPQGSVISPLLFNIMINDVFANVQPRIGRSLFADDGSLWKRGKNVKYTLKKVQEALTLVEDWGRKWGFRFSIEKTKVMFFTQKKIDESIKLELYGRNLERVKSLKFLGGV
uniref:Reverse transcriptase domain-containing protein n=1 Tax=Sparus aurata TaxID=8175 RepID=A0A671TUX8_SPAAU